MIYFTTVVTLKLQIKFFLKFFEKNHKTFDKKLLQDSLTLLLFIEKVSMKYKKPVCVSMAGDFNSDLFVK